MGLLERFRELGANMPGSYPLTVEQLGVLAEKTLVNARELLDEAKACLSTTRERCHLPYSPPKNSEST